MSNEEYQALIRIKDGAELRRRLTDVADAAYRRGDPSRGRRHAGRRAQRPDRQSRRSRPALPARRARPGRRRRPTRRRSIFAYTVKGQGSALRRRPAQPLSAAQPGADGRPSRAWGIPEDGPVGRLPAGRVRPVAWCAAAAGRLRRRAGARPARSPRRRSRAISTSASRRSTSTQEALGRALARLADVPDVGERLVTLSPDVATSTHLAGWINKAGVFAQETAHDFEAGAQRMLKWNPAPAGHHIELGISEMNLFMALGQFGLSHELTGQHLIPIGTVYDPFVCRGLDALIYSLYVGGEDDLRRHPGRRLAQPGGRRPPEHRHAVARDRAAGRRLLRAGLRPRGRVDACSRRSAAAATASTVALDLPAALDQTDRPDADGRNRSRASARTSCAARCSPAAIASSTARTHAPDLPAARHRPDRGRRDHGPGGDRRRPAAARRRASPPT